MGTPAAVSSLPLVCMGAFLIFSAYVNLNDPDAALWSTAYTLGAVMCFTASSVTRGSSSSSLARVLHGLALCTTAASLVLSAYSFSGLEKFAVSGLSGWLGAFELEPIREGGGALIMAAAQWLVVMRTGSSDKSVEAGASSTLVTFVAVVVAALSIGLGVFLPPYYRSLGVGIPEHCGGSEEM
jgi:hypothetical protein